MNEELLSIIALIVSLLVFFSALLQNGLPEMKDFLLAVTFGMLFTFVTAVMSVVVGWLTIPIMLVLLFLSLRIISWLAYHL